MLLYNYGVINEWNSFYLSDELGREVLQGRAASKGPAGTRGEEHTPGLGVAAARWRRGT